jgi:hypothetical protein
LKTCKNKQILHLLQHLIRNQKEWQKSIKRSTDKRVLFKTKEVKIIQVSF